MEETKHGDSLLAKPVNKYPHVTKTIRGEALEKQTSCKWTYIIRDEFTSSVVSTSA